MSPNREKDRQARLIAFFALFSAEAGGLEVEEALQNVLQNEDSEGIWDEITKRVVLWKKNADYIDGLIEKHLSRGGLCDLANVAKSVLRLGFCEMEFMNTIPPEVAINEAVELAKTYGDPDLARFVNALMDARLKERKTEEYVNDK